MKVIYIGMFNEQGYAGLTESSYAKRKEVVAAIASAAGGKLIDLMYLQGDWDMAAIMEMPDIETASGLMKSVVGSGIWEDMMMFPEFDLDKGLKAINAVKSVFKAPGEE
jgi:uncharacterized protein with GYD domain